MNYPRGTLILAAIEDAIYDFIYSQVQGVLEGDQIIWRNQSQPLPPRPCVTLKFTAGPSTTDRDGNLISGGSSGPDVVGSQMEATLSVQVFGNTQIHRPMAAQLALDLHSSLLTRAVKMQLSARGIGIMGNGRTLNLTAVEETEYEERGGFEIDLSMAQNLVDKVETIGTINLGGEVSEIPVDQEITLP